MSDVKKTQLIRITDRDGTDYLCAAVERNTDVEHNEGQWLGMFSPEPVWVPPFSEIKGSTVTLEGVYWDSVNGDSEPHDVEIGSEYTLHMPTSQSHLMQTTGNTKQLDQ